MSWSIENRMDENVLDTWISPSLEATRFHSNQLSLELLIEGSLENSHTIPLSHCDAQLSSACDSTKSSHKLILLESFASFYWRVASKTDSAGESSQNDSTGE